MLEILVTMLGVLMSLGYYPQAYKIYKNKRAHDISIPTYVIFSAGTLLWVIYGFYTNDIPIVISFAVGVGGSWLVLGFSLYYKRQEKVMTRV